MYFFFRVVDSIVKVGEIIANQYFPLNFHKPLSEGSLTWPNDKLLYMTKLKTFADKINVAQMLIPFFDRIENILGKGEKADYQHFLLFPQWFLKGFFLGVVKSQDCVVKI